MNGSIINHASQPISPHSETLNKHEASILSTMELKYIKSKVYLFKVLAINCKFNLTRLH